MVLKHRDVGRRRESACARKGSRKGWGFAPLVFPVPHRTNGYPNTQRNPGRGLHTHM